MICQECNQRPATLHFTKIMNGEKTEVHLCEKCAQEKGELFMINTASGFSINNLLAGLLNIDPSFQHTTQNAFQQKEVLQCEGCSMTFPQFVNIGRFGCAECYETFKEPLKPILRRLHSGNWNHNGKIPKRMGGTISLRKQIEDLKQNLRDLIAHEKFEQAAEIRDHIRTLTSSLNEIHEGGE